MFQTTPSSNSIEQIKEESNRIHALTVEISKVIVGQREIVDFITMALLCNGHLLLEGVPGVAKTTLIKTVAQALGLGFNRIQFTPDLLPADLIGTQIYNPKTQDFEVKKGPIFANLILADEINRSPAKVQSALLESMQERQVTIGSHTFILSDPFLVFATQNPLEQEGTYRLPEAQVDRFMFKLLVTYGNQAQEKEIILKSKDAASINQVLSIQDIKEAQKLVNTIYVDEKIIEYIVNLVFATRGIEPVKNFNLKQYIQYGVSPRATLALYHAARAQAFLKKRHFVVPDDIKEVAPAILRHRLIMNYEAEADGISSDILIKKLLDSVPTP